MLENFSRSLQSIFYLYKEKRNSYFEFSFTFALFSLFCSIFFTTIVCLVAKEIYVWEGSDKEILSEDVVAMSKCLKLMSYYFVLSFGIYAIYLRKLLNIDSQNTNLENQKPTLKGLFKSLTPSNKSNILKVISVISIVYLLFFKSLFGYQEGNLGIFNYIGLDNSIIRNLLFWLNSIVELLKQYLPYLASFYIFLSDYNPSFSFKDISKYKNAIFIFVLISFCIVAISGHLKSYIDVYVINLITIPVHTDFVKIIIQSFCYVFVSSFFYLGFAASMIYSVVNQYNTQE